MATTSEFTQSALGLQGRATQGVRYPAPWFDIANTTLPQNIRALIKWCRYYGTVHPISGVLRKMAEYPITDLIWETDSDELRATYKEIFEETLNIKSELVSAGIDYYTFGNSFISLVTPVRRFLVCKKCKKTTRISKVPFEFKNWEFIGTCKSCGSDGIMKVYDVPLKSRRKIRIKRWEPELINIEHNEITGRSTYMMHLSPHFRNSLRKGSKYLLEDTPEIFLRTAKKNLPVQFDETRLFHFKRPSLAGKTMGWGEPVIQPVMKYLFYLQILMKHREASAQQGISPLRILYPSSQGDFNVYESLNLGEWKRKVENEIKCWRQDPNRIAVMPVPLGYETIGGEHPSVNTTPEIQQLMDDIIAGMQIPKSFYYGGAPYSGTSAEFRMLENHFLSFQKQCLQLLNSFLIPQVAKFLDIPIIKARFSDLRVADDVQKKQLLLNMNAQRPKKISDATLMAEFAIDSDREKEAIHEERKKDFEAAVQELEDQAEAQGRADIIAIRNQVRGQVIAELERERVKKELLKEGYTEDEIYGIQDREMPQGQPLEDPGNPASAGPPPEAVAQIRETIANLPPDQQEAEFKRLQRENPTLFAALMQQQSPEGSPDVDLGREANQVDMREAPKQRPPNRNAPMV